MRQIRPHLLPNPQSYWTSVTPSAPIALCERPEGMVGQAQEKKRKKIEKEPRGNIIGVVM